MRNFFEPTASPSWLRQVLTSIRAALGDIWPAPLRLKDYATAELPAAADFAQGLVWDGTLSRVSVSDGAAWIGLQPWDSTLAALAGLDAAAGILVETAADTFARRSLAAPAAGLTIANPAGTAGNPTFALANDLAALEGLAATGFAARIAADAWAQRSLTAPAAGLAIANNDGVGGNPAFALANDLSAVEGLAGAGLAARTGTDAWAVRTLTAPAAGITVSNGSGAAGNPTLALANDLAALEALSGTSTIYYRSGADTWSAVTIGGNLGFAAGILGSALGTAATRDTGTSGTKVPLLDGANTFSADQSFSAGIRQSGATTVALENSFAALPAGRAGPGLEMGISGSVAVIQAYNRTSSAYIGQNFTAASFLFRPNATDILLVTTGGITVTGTLNATGNVTLGDAAADSHVLKGSTKIGGGEGAGSLTIDRIGSLVGRFRLFVGDGTAFTVDEPYYAAVNASHRWLAGAAGATQVGVLDTNGFAPLSTTTASAANVFQSGSGTVLLRSTSSKRYKRAIRDLAGGDAERVLALRPVAYRSTAKADDPGRVRWGFIAEEAHEILPELVNYDDAGLPDGFQYERVVVGLLGVVKRLEARVWELETARRS
jgi:hypothetical protein